MNILITGASGFLGNELIKQCSDRNYNVVGIANSETRIQKTKFLNSEIPIFSLDIYSDVDRMNQIIKEYKVEYIIHAAAMKHIGICEDNACRTVEVNVIGSKNVMELALQNNIKNAICISTDKAINPTSAYGSSKYLMEKMFLENNFSVFQGVNYFYSTGSVLDIWDNQIREEKQLTVNKNNSTRYFVEVQEVAKTLLDNIDVKGEVMSTSYCYKIKLYELAKAFCEYHEYENVKYYTGYTVEKVDEEFPDDIKIIDTDISDIKMLLENYYRNKK